MDVITSIPYSNTNGMGFTKETLKNSYQTMKSTPLDYEHEQRIILGHVIEPELIEDGEFLILRTVSITWKERLKEWDLEDLSKSKFSMECLYDQYDFWVKSKGLIKKEDAPVEWIEGLKKWDYNEPVFDSDTNERVILLLGGESGFVEFNGIGITYNPADKTSKTLYQAASEKQNDQTEQNNNENNIKEGENKPMSFKIFENENDYNAAIASAVSTAVANAVAAAKQEVETNLTNTVIAQLKTDLQTAQASLQTNQTTITEKDTLIADLTGKLQTAEVSVLDVTKRAESAELKLNEIAIAKQVEDRKQVLAKSNYECDEEDLKMLATASQTEFDIFVKRIDKAQASVKKAVASQFNIDPNFSIGLTVNDETNTQNNQEKVNTKILAF